MSSRASFLPLLALSASVLASLMVGCASGPGQAPGSPGSRASLPGGRAGAQAPRFPDKDGAPSDAPPDLALLPDPVPQIEPIRSGGPNKPYVVLGQSYEPVATDVAWKERGLASWYGTKFHGRRTASGEMFSMYGLTAAHRTLPIPSYARVRNLANGKETIVRINDRGPFHSSRVMDLSYAAAVKLGIVATGSAQVEIERLTFDDIRSGAWRRGDPGDGPQLASDAAPATNAGSAALPPDEDAIMAAASKGSAVTSMSTPAVDASQAESNPGAATPLPSAPVPMKEARERAYTPDAKGYWVQLAALGKREGVDQLQQKVASELGALLPMLAVFHEAPYFKLQVGPYSSRRQAMAAAQQAKTALQLAPMVVERR